MSPYHARIVDDGQRAFVAPGTRSLFLDIHGSRQAICQRCIHNKAARLQPILCQRNPVNQHAGALNPR